MGKKKVHIKLYYENGQIIIEGTYRNGQRIE